MAVAESILFSRLTGKIGDLRYWNNQWHGIIVGAQNVGSQPDTTDQVRWRTAFGNAVSLWQSIPQADRDVWLDYSRSIIPRRRGYPLRYNGQTAFLQVMVKAWYARSRGWVAPDPIGTPPSIPGYLSFPGMKLDPVAPGFTGVRYKGKHLNSETCVCMYNRSGEQNLTRLRYKGPWAQALQQTRTSAQFIILQTVGVPADKNHWFRLRLMTSGDPFRISATEYLMGMSVAVPP